MAAGAAGKGLATAATGLVRTSLSRGALGRALTPCIVDAVEDAAAEQLRDASAMATVISEAVLAAGRPEELFFSETVTRHGLGHARPRWAEVVRRVVRATEGLELGALDLHRFGNDFADALDLRLRRDARKSGSPLLPALLLAQLTPLPVDPSGHPDHDGGRRGHGPSEQGRGLQGFGLRKNDREGGGHYQERPTAEGAVRIALDQHARCVVVGGPGNGKSAVARAVARGSDRTVFWLRAGDRRTLQADCAAALTSNGLDDTEDPIAALMAAVSTSGDCLIVLDGVERAEDVEPFDVAAAAGTSLIMTAQSDLDLPRAWTVPLSPLGHVESTDLLRQLAGVDGQDGEDLDDLATFVGGSPLVLQQVASYMRSTRLSAADVLDRLRGDTTAVLERFAPRDHPDSFALTFAQNLARAVALHRESGAVLAMIAVCGDVGIPRQLLLAAVQPDGDAVFAVDDALAALRAVGLVETEDSGVVRCHSLVARLHGPATADSVRDGCRTALDMLLLSSGTRQAIAFDSFAPSVPMLVRAAGQSPDEDFTIFTDLARTAVNLSRASGFRSAFQAAGALVDQTTSPEVARATLMGLEGAFLTHEGRMTEADEVLSGALALGVGVGNTAAVMDALISRILGLEWRSRYSDALRAVDELEERFGEEVGGVVAIHRALIRAEQLAPGAAVALLEPLLSVDADPGHQDLLRETLSHAHLAAGRPERAVPILRERAEYARRTTGEDSTLYAAKLNDLGWAQLDAGELEEAEARLEDSVAIYERAGGGTHRFAAIPYLHLGRLSIKRAELDPDHGDGHLDEAERVLARAVALLEPDSASSRDMASVLFAQGDVHLTRASIWIDQRRGEGPSAAAQLTVALRRFRRARAIDAQVFGDPSGDTAIDDTRLALVYIRLHDEVRAHAALRSALRFYRSPSSEFTELAAGTEVNVLDLDRKSGRSDQAELERRRGELAQRIAAAEFDPEVAATLLRQLR